MIIDHSYTAENFLKVIGMLGGHTHFIMLFLGKLAAKINKNVITAKLIRSNYFMKRPSSMKASSHPNSMTYDLSVIKLNYFNSCFKYSYSKRDNMVDKQELFQKGSARLNQDLCVYNIITLLRKL